MMFRREDRYRQFQKNPFQGEIFRVHMTVDDLDDVEVANNMDYEKVPHVQEALANEGRFVRAFRELTPSRKIEYSKGSETEKLKRWDEYEATLNAADTYISWLRYQGKRIEDPTAFPLKDSNGNVVTDANGNPQPFDLSNSVWESRVRGIYEAHKNAEDSGAINPNVLSYDIAQKVRDMRGRDVDQVKRQILNDIGHIIIGIEEQKRRVEAGIKQEIKADFLARVEYMQQMWEIDPPSHFKNDPEALKKWEELLAQTKASIDSNLSEDTPYPTDASGGRNEFKEIHKDLDRLESFYAEGIAIDEYAEAAGEKLNHAQLTARLDEAEKLRAKQVAKVQAKFSQQMGTAKAKVSQFLAQVQSAHADKFGGPDDKAKVIENLQKTLNGLNKHDNIAQYTKDMLFSEELLSEEKAPNDRIKFKKGLKHQIDVLLRDDLTPEEIKVISVGVEQALGQFESFISNENNLLGNLSSIVNQIEVYESQLNAKSPPWNAPGQGKFFGYKFYFLAPYDAVRAGQIIGEWGKRTYNRAARRRLGQFGSQALSFLDKGPFQILATKTLPNEFDKEAENAEQEEVNVYKEAYSNKDMWQVEERAAQTTSVDEFKACLLLLAENGRLRWDKLAILRQLNRFQSAVSFEMDRRVHLKDIPKFHEKLNKACGAIWDFDTFRDIDKQNTSSYNSKMQEYVDRIHILSDSVGGLGAVAKDLLDEYLEYKRGGANPKFDPLFYDKLIEYSIQQGKMAPEEKLYFLIQGIAHGILPPDRAAHYSSTLINDYPAIDFFGSVHPTLGHNKKPDLQLIQKIAELDKQAFQDFFYDYIMNLKQVRERANKVLSGRGKLDHDDFTANAPYLGAGAIEAMLTEHSDGFGIPETGMENGSEAMLFFIRHFANNRGTYVKDKHFVQYVGSFVRFSGISQNRMHKGKTGYFRFGQNSLDKEARVNGLYSSYGLVDEEMNLNGRVYKPNTVRDNLKKTEEYIAMIDPEFFGLLFNRHATEAEVTALVKRLAQKYGVKDYKEMFDNNEVKTIDNLHTFTGEFVQFVISTQQGRAAYNNMLATVERDNQNYFKDFKAQNPKAKTVVEKRAEFYRAIKQPARDINEDEYAGTWTIGGSSNNADYYKQISA